MPLWQLYYHAVWARTRKRKPRMAVPTNLPAIESLAVAIAGNEHRTQRQGTLADFFAASPLRDSGLKIERSQDGLRELSMIALTERDTER